MSAPLSGTRVRLESGGYVAEIASVGASLRSLTADGRDLVVPYAADQVRPLFRGAVLVPWPNRVVDGRYTFDGVPQQLAITEPDRGHALHGLVAWTDFAVTESGGTRAVLETEVPAQAGYPHRLAVTVTSTLDDRGLETRIRSVNTGPSAAPYGTSGHPYLVGGEGRVDDWTLTFGAAEVLEVDPERLVPQGLAPVPGGPFDFSAGRRIGDLFIDHAFTGLARDDAGLAHVEVRAGDGHGARLTWDAVCPWVQIHTGDRPEPEWNRAGLAAEPMTCPPDAFHSGTDLVVLQPGDAHEAAWRIDAV
ncbi:MAG: aldose 1-epimerase family protein [Amnibacterium sp.]